MSLRLGDWHQARGHRKNDSLGICSLACILNLDDDLGILVWQARRIHKAPVKSHGEDTPFTALGEIIQNLTSSGEAFIDPCCLWNPFISFQIHDKLGIRWDTFGGEVRPLTVRSTFGLCQFSFSTNTKAKRTCSQVRPRNSAWIVTLKVILTRTPSSHSNRWGNKIRAHRLVHVF